MKLQLTRWQQYGLMISAAWILAVTVYVRQTETPRAQDYAMRAYYICAEKRAAAGDKDINPCLENVEKDWDHWMNRKWETILQISLLPVAAGWAIAFAGVFVYRRMQQR